jgi:hypothetical protein
MGGKVDLHGILEEGLQGYDDRAKGIVTLITVYKSMGLPEWIEGARWRAKKALHLLVLHGFSLGNHIGTCFL